VLANINNNNILYQKWAGLIASLRNQTELTKIVETNRAKINTITASYLEEGCPLPSNKTFKPKNLLGNEIWAPDKYGNILMNSQPEVCNALRSLIDKIKL
jgi:hypothetical protein